MVASSSSSGKRKEQAAEGVQTQPYSKTIAKEIRRSRGEIACAECRRLKVRCNRQIPCATCISRGCVALCPNGILPPGDTSRFVSAAKDHLQQKISKLHERMRSLEDALAIAQAAEGDEPHPLLQEPLRFEDEGTPEAEEEDEGAGAESSQPAEELADSFGTLHIDERWKTLRFYGPTGAVEGLLDDEHPSEEGLDVDDNILDLRALGFPPELDAFYYAFPLAPTGIPTGPIRSLIESYLPPRDRAISLCRTFLEHMSWMLQLITFQQFAKELLPSIYASDPSDRRIRRCICGPHDLALFFGVCALGALVDLNLPPYNTEAQIYYVLCRSALALDPLLERASLATVKTMHIVSLYNGMSGKESNMSNTYTVLNLASRLAGKIGLHVDPSHWKLSPKEAYDRRTYFWNLLQGDIWQSLGTGRPPALANAYGHCRIPTEEEERQYQQGEADVGFGIWGFHASEKLLIPVMKIAMSAKPPSYREVIELDRRIRSFKLPATPHTVDSPSTAASLMCFVRSHYLEVILLALHRAFFAQALAMNPQNPLDGPYGHSFLTVYQCAWKVIETTSYTFRRHHGILSRIWMIWSFSFSSAVVLGAVASRCKDLEIDPPPLAALHQACLLFEAGSKTNSRAAKALPVLLNLRERAIRLHGATAKEENPNFGEELAILAGRPRLTVTSPLPPRPLTSDSTVPRQKPTASTRGAHSAPPAIPPISTAGPSRLAFRDARPTPEASPGGWTPQHALAGAYGVPGDGFHASATAAAHPEPHLAAQHQQQLEGYASGVSPDLWDMSPHGAEAYPYAAAPEAQAVDFNLGDAWQSFMQNYANM